MLAWLKQDMETPRPSFRLLGFRNLGFGSKFELRLDGLELEFGLGSDETGVGVGLNRPG